MAPRPEPSRRGSLDLGVTPARPDEAGRDLRRRGLPAPLGPSRPSSSPASTDRSTPRGEVDPYRLVSWWQARERQAPCRVAGSGSVQSLSRLGGQCRGHARGDDRAAPQRPAAPARPGRPWPRACRPRAPRARVVLGRLSMADGLPRPPDRSSAPARAPCVDAILAALERCDSSRLTGWARPERQLPRRDATAAAHARFSSTRQLRLRVAGCRRVARAGCSRLLHGRGGAGRSTGRAPGWPTGGTSSSDA